MTINELDGLQLLLIDEVIIDHPKGSFQLIYSPEEVEFILSFKANKRCSLAWSENDYRFVASFDGTLVDHILKTLIKDVLFAFV